MASNKTFFKVPVAGGELNCARWSAKSGAPVAIALHGITSSHMAWELLANQLAGSIDLIAPDLRGRGGSQHLPPPFGLEAHAQDVVRIAEYLELQHALILGHSLGAYIAIEYAAQFPDQADRLVLIDGGPGLPAPVGVAPEDFLKLVLGPALARLQQTFASNAAYFEFWRQHPALAEDWSDYIEQYLVYDLGGEPPELTPRICEDAVLTDGKGPISPQAHERIKQVHSPMLLVRATRGLLNEPTPLLPMELVTAVLQKAPSLEVQTLEDTNHYTILMGRGVQSLARAIVKFCQP